MKKAILACILAIIALSMSSYAAMDCSIVTDSEPLNIHECSDGEIIFTISDLADGGSHAIPKKINGIDVPGVFPKVVCCKGVAGLTAKAETSEPASFQHKVGYFADGHFNRTGSIPPFSTGLWLDAPTAIDCDYKSIDCTEAGYNTCLFTISDDSPGYSHVSGCGGTEFPFNTPNSWRYCCSSGEATCDIVDTYWAIIRGTEIEYLAGDEPLGPIGGGMSVYLLVETNGNCEEGTKADFTIKRDGAEIPGLNPFKTDVVLGTEDDGSSLGDDSFAAAFWGTAGSADGNPPFSSGIYTFEVNVHKADAVPPISRTRESAEVEIEGDGCRAEDPALYFSEECEGELPQACIDDASCDDGATCDDMDCDTVADCIGGYMGTEADPSTVSRCLGDVRGTSICTPAMDCTNLLWSECKNCEAGQECDTVGGFDAGAMFMERCVGMTADECKCEWAGAIPTGCTEDVLNQYGNRFKECIEDEEFPFFDGFNVIAVLLVLSMYYGIVIIRKKK